MTPRFNVGSYHQSQTIAVSRAHVDHLRTVKISAHEKKSGLYSGARSISSRPNSSQTNQPLYISTVDAEPIHRYAKGGYHPVTLGDNLKCGRYKVLHKLGWGGYSTVWAARDERRDTYVAVKISVAEAEDRERRKLDIMQQLASDYPPHKHVVQMLDYFDLKGPNGSHKCLVYELMGPNIPDVVNSQLSGGRLPGKLAKAIAKQSLVGLDALHQKKIGHGDLHTRNLAFTFPNMDRLTETEFLEMLGTTETGQVERRDGEDLELGIPEYLVMPASYKVGLFNSTAVPTIKIIDFGESFLHTAVPQTLHTPLHVRAPEVLFKDRIDHRVDLWSMGCMLFELFTGQPPFDTFLLTPAILAGQMREIASDDLPARWQKIWDIMRADSSYEDNGLNLQQWLEEVYFDGPHTPDLTREDIVKLGQIIASLLYFEPSSRASARQVLDDPWFSE